MKEKIYRLSPIWLKTIFVNIIAKKNFKKRYGDNYERYLNEYIALWKKDLPEILEYQSEMLIKLLKECYRYVPFYQLDFKRKKIQLEDIEKEPHKVLSKLDILSKPDRKNKVQELINTNPDRPATGTGTTSGTTGSPTLNYIDQEATERAFALWSRFHRNIGIKKGDRSVRFSARLVVKSKRSRPPFWIYNKTDDQLFMSTYHMTSKNLKSYITKLNQFKPKLLDGYPSALYILAKYINTKKIKLSFKPSAIAVTAETLYEYRRREIESAFGCKVYNQYASSEGSPFITECSEGKLHINEDSGIFEFLNKNNQPAQPGEMARMVVTSFRNWKVPLLRYDINDNVLLSKTQVSCKCGCKMPYVAQIIGREDDILWTEEKGYVGRMSTANFRLKGLVKSQYIQKNKDLLIINQIVNGEYDKKVEKELINNIKTLLGESIEIKINLVKDIPLDPGGKFHAVKREFDILDNF